MSILIKNQDMPKEGEKYLFEIRHDGTVYDAIGQRVAAIATKFDESASPWHRAEDRRMSDLIDRQALEHWIRTECASIDTYADKEYVIERWRKELPTIEAVPVKFIDEVIEYLTKCRDYAIHEETKTTWDERRQTLIMLLHEWAAWNECGRTGKYGERREG